MVISWIFFAKIFSLKGTVWIEPTVRHVNLETYKDIKLDFTIHFSKNVIYELFVRYLTS